MKLVRSICVSFLGAVWAISQASAAVVINEIHYNPDVKTEPAEFVELYNAGTNPVSPAGRPVVQADGRVRHIHEPHRQGFRPKAGWNPASLLPVGHSEESVGLRRSSPMPDQYAAGVKRKARSCAKKCYQVQVGDLTNRTM